MKSTPRLLLSRRVFLFAGGLVPASVLAGCGGGGGGGNVQSNSASRAGATYTVTPLLPTTGTFEATDISETGVVAGLHHLPPSGGIAFPREAVVYENGTFRAVAPVAANAQAVSALNNRGTVVGVFVSPANPQKQIPLLFVDGQLIDAADARFGGTVPYIRELIGVNDRGDVLAATSTFAPSPDDPPSEVTQFGASVLQAGSGANATQTPVALVPPAEAHLFPVGINASGAVVGRLINKTGPLDERAFVWTNGALSVLPTLTPGQMTTATCIGDDGTVGGQIAVNDPYRPDTAVLWPANGDAPIVLPGPSERFTRIADVNANGVAVGSAVTSALQYPGMGGGVGGPPPPQSEWVQGSVPMIWQNGGYRDMNELLAPGAGWRVHALTRITNSGLILAHASPQENPFATGTYCILSPQ